MNVDKNGGHVVLDIEQPKTRLEMGNCHQCSGTGRFERPEYDGRPAEIVTCWRCDGEGRALVETIVRA